MRFEGTLKTWYEDRGFGSVVSKDGGEPLFVHISAFPSDTYLPQRGETLSFEVITAASGRKEASRVQRVRAAVQQNGPRRSPVLTARRGPHWMTVTAAILVLTALGGVQMFRHFQPAASQQFALLAQKTVH